MQTSVLSRQEVYEKIIALENPEDRERAVKIALKLYGEAPKTAKFAPFTFDPEGYIKRFLNWEPWNGTEKHPGQIQIIEAYVLALRQQLERRDYELGVIKKKDLKFWKPGQVIQNYLRIEAGHTTGKTKIESGLVNHFLDCFAPSTALMYGPGMDSLKDNLWQELEVDRKYNKELPGKMYDSMEIRIGPNHFGKARVASDAHGKGSERIQGKHGEYLMFVLDEAEGIADFVFDAIDSMTSGGISIVIMVANPKTRTSRFHKAKKISNVKSFRMSCLHHPNVVAGKEVVPNAVRRHYVEQMVEKHCDVVQKMKEEDFTFKLPYPINTKTKVLPANKTIFSPKPEFMFRVMGVAPLNLSSKTAVTAGVYEAAKERVPEGDKKTISIARLGVDVARYGTDNGTLYIRWQDAIWKTAEFSKQNSKSYFRVIKKESLKLAKKGVTSLHIRIDGGGGFGNGVIDLLLDDDDLNKSFEDFQVFECHFNGLPYDQTKYYDLITECYFETGESLKSLSVVSPPEALEIDLTEREYTFKNKGAKELKKLESKEDFKKRKKVSSPDDGDGFVLAAAPDFCFNKVNIEIIASGADQPKVDKSNAVDDLMNILGI